MLTTVRERVCRWLANRWVLSGTDNDTVCDYSDDGENRGKLTARVVVYES